MESRLRRQAHLGEVLAAVEDVVAAIAIAVVSGQRVAVLHLRRLLRMAAHNVLDADAFYFNEHSPGCASATIVNENCCARQGGHGLVRHQQPVQVQALRPLDARHRLQLSELHPVHPQGMTRRPHRERERPIDVET